MSQDNTSAAVQCYLDELGQDAPAEPAVRALLDLAVYVDAPKGSRVAGLISRQVSFGLKDEQARDWVHRSDEANARVVEATRAYADVVLTR